MEVELVVEVGWSWVVQGFVDMDERLEMASLHDWEPVKLLDMGGDVGPSGEVEDESGCGVQYGLQSLQEVHGDSCVECVAVV